MNTILTSFLLVLVSEMGDKTQLLAFSLAARYKKPLPILAGILAATLVNHGLASYLGSTVAMHVPRQWLAAGLALLFFAFGLWTLKPDSYEESRASDRFGPFLTTTVLFFLAEMGDKTQLATIALGARFHSTALVTLGTTLGMLVADGLAVFLGEKLGQHVPMWIVRWIAAALFFLFALFSLLDALGVKL